MEIVSGILFILSLIFWFIVILIPLVVVHELGHTLMAWLFKIRVVEFGVGMPPRTRIWTRWKKMLLSLNWLPLGGFAKIYGDHDALDNAVSDLPVRGQEAVKETYRSERLLEVIDSDLPALLENNGLTYTKEWEEFHKKVQKNQWIIKDFTQNFNLKEGWQNTQIAQKSKLSQEELGEIEGKLKQVVKLMDWELGGMKNTKTAFFNRGLLPKIAVLIGGVLFNYIFAWLLIFGLLNFGSVTRMYESESDLSPLSTSYVVTNQGLNSTLRVQKNSVLDKAGVPDRAKFISLNGKTLDEIKTFDSFRAEVQQIGENDASAELIYTKPNQSDKVSVQIKPEKQADGNYKIGARLLSQQSYKAKDFGSSFVGATEEVNKGVNAIWNSLGEVFKALMPNATDRKALDSVGGPVAIAGYGSLTYELLGAAGIVYIMAMISLSLAVFNLLPLPVLDGGRIVLAFINKLTGNRNRKLEAILINGTMLVLLLLFVLIAFRDVGTVRSLFS